MGNAAKIAEEFNLAAVTSSPIPSGDIHPSEKAVCIVSEDKKNILQVWRWGFSSRQPKQTTKSALLINARAETLAVKPTFREAFQKRRCLVVADGFYEWSKEKKPYYFYLQSHRPFGLAGIFQSKPELVAGGGEASFVIITTAPNPLVARIHDRMPAIIPHDKRSLWLDNASYEKTELESLMTPYPDEEMEMRPAAFVNGR